MFCLLSLSIHAETILQENVTAAGVFYAPYLKGQSFLAEDPQLHSIGVNLQVFNPQFVDTAVKLSLFGGRGLDGPLIAQTSMTLEGLERFDIAWMDFSMIGISVVPGQTYTFSIQSLTPYWGARYNQWSTKGGPLTGTTDYTGGEFLTEVGFAHNMDMAFRVIAVPEPNVVWLAVMGAVLLFKRR